MTPTRSFDRELESWLAAEAPSTAPAGLHDAAIERARRSRPRPGWVVAVLGASYGTTTVVGRRPVRAASILLVIALLLAALAAAVAVGALLSDPQEPTLGRDGLIAYSVFENGRQTRSQTSRFYVMDSDGMSARRMGSGTCPTYSMDGSWLVHRSDWMSSEVVVQAVDGSSRSVVLPEDDRIHPSRRPYALSPDGSRLAWIKPLAEYTFDLPDGSSENGLASNELWVTAVSGGSGTRIVAPSSVQNETYWEPAWSPDGSRVAFQSHVAAPSADGPSFRSAIYVVDADGSYLHRVSARPATGAWSGLSWSPDGRYLAYLGLPDGAALPSSAPDDPGYREPALDVFVIGVDGTGDRNVTNSIAFDRRPSWSPDGSHLAFETSDDGDRYRLAIAAMDGGLLAAAPRIGPASDTFAWSPDGTQLLSVSGNSMRLVGTDHGSPLVSVHRVASDDPVSDWSIETDCAPSWQRLDP